MTAPDGTTMKMLRCKTTLAVPLAFLACACASHAGENPAPDSLRQSRNSFVALPYAYYTPETKFAFGAGSIYSFRPRGGAPEARPSNLRLALTGTQLKQFIVAFLPELYFENERYFLNGYIGCYRYPDKFWGVGDRTPDGAEEGYVPDWLKFNVNLQRLVAPGLYIGLRYQYEYMSLRETDPEGALRLGAVPGSSGGVSSGIGVILSHDTRDNIYQPSKGFYNQVYAVVFARPTGSDYDFNLLSVDLRRYFSLFGSHVLAVQTFDSFISGEAPFQMLGMYGSSYWMRGYYSGRYRDKHLITFQTEYRMPVYWRFGAAAFAGLGAVSDEAATFRADRFRFSFGAGARFMFDRRERINARLDVGFDEDGNPGIYALVAEAF